MTTPTIARSDLDFPLVVTSLMKGVVYADSHAKTWRHLVPLQARVRDYVSTIGLIVVIDEAEGYAYLRQRDDADVPDGELGPVPRLVPRRSLSFPVSLLLALLRKRLAEFDASDGGTTLVLSRRQIVEMLEVFLPAASTEARLVDQIDGHLGKVVDLGFLRAIKESPADTGASYEVRRILKAFVDAQWLAGLDAGLRHYAVQVGAVADQGPDDVEAEGTPR